MSWPRELRCPLSHLPGSRYSVLQARCQLSTGKGSQGCDCQGWGGHSPAAMDTGECCFLGSQRSGQAGWKAVALEASGYRALPGSGNSPAPPGHGALPDQCVTLQGSLGATLSPESHSSGPQAPNSSSLPVPLRAPSSLSGPSPTSPGPHSAGRTPEENPEALEEFRKFVQRKGLLQEKIIIPKQRGEQLSLSAFSPGSLHVPNHLPCLSYLSVPLKSLCPHTGTKEPLGLTHRGSGLGVTGSGCWSRPLSSPFP